MGLPIIMGVEGESAEIVAAAKCGICIRPSDSDALAKAIVDLQKNQDLLNELGSAGQEASKKYTRRANAEKLLKSLDFAIRRHTDLRRRAS